MQSDAVTPEAIAALEAALEADRRAVKKAKAIPEKELWLWKNQAALGRVLEGLHDAQAKEFVVGPDIDKDAEQFDTLPGRVLDAKVASVLGWERTERTGLRWNDPEGKPAPLPHYSTDLAAAWQIIEHFTAKQIPVQVSWPAPGGWACLLCGLRSIGNGATAQLAICRAVLAANWLMF